MLPLGIGTALRLFLVVAFLGVALTGDENAYLRLGWGWREFGAYTGIWAPLYPKLVSVLHAAFGDAAADAMRFLQVGLAAWIGVWIALVADLFGGRRAAIGAAWIFALYLPIAGFCALMYSETLYLSFFVPGLYQMLRLVREGRVAAPWWRAPLAGGLLGLAALTRESTMLFVPACAVWIAFALRREGPLALGPAFGFALTAALCVLPWTIRNAHAFDRFVPIATSTGGSSFIGWNAYDVNYDLAGLGESALDAPGRLRGGLRGEAPPPWTARVEANRADQARVNVRDGLAFALDHPLYFARSRVVEFVDLVSPLSFPVRSQRIAPVGAPLDRPVVGRTVAILSVLMVPVLLLLALLGWATARDAGPLRSLATMMLVCTSGVALVNGLSRYRIPVVPILIVLAAIFLFGGREQPTARRRVALCGAIAILVLAWIPSLGPVRLALSELW